LVLADFCFSSERAPGRRWGCERAEPGVAEALGVIAGCDRPVGQGGWLSTQRERAAVGHVAPAVRRVPAEEDTKGASQAEVDCGLSPS